MFEGIPPRCSHRFCSAGGFPCAEATFQPGDPG
jgi:hypothetical protein